MANNKPHPMRFILGIAAPVLVAIGTSIPIIKTFLGYSYSIVDVQM